MSTGRTKEELFKALRIRGERGEYDVAAAMRILDMGWCRPKAEQFVDDDGIHFAGMLGICQDDDHEKEPEPFTRAHDKWEPCSCVAGAAGWSSGERQLVKLAANLYNSSNDWLNLARLIDTLDDQMIVIAFDAIRIRSFGYKSWLSDADILVLVGS
jgi:hypothetical protein